MDQIVNVIDTYNILSEGLDITGDRITSSNKFINKPHGFIIQDTYNNPFYPIKPMPKIDTSKIETIDVYKRYRDLYRIGKSLYLPWHFCVEFVELDYMVFNTRPIDIKFPMKSKDVDKNNCDNTTLDFLSKNIFDISDALHICIIGDTSNDVYTKNLYKLISEVCLRPFIYTYKLPRGLFQSIFILNIGQRFNVNYLEKTLI